LKKVVNIRKINACESKTAVTNITKKLDVSSSNHKKISLSLQKTNHNRLKNSKKGLNRLLKHTK
jgi:hypothetical protein